MGNLISSTISSQPIEYKEEKENVDMTSFIPLHFAALSQDYTSSFGQPQVESIHFGLMWKQPKSSIRDKTIIAKKWKERFFILLRGALFYYAVRSAFGALYRVIRSNLPVGTTV